MKDYRLEARQTTKYDYYEVATEIAKEDGIETLAGRSENQKQFYFRAAYGRIAKWLEDNDNNNLNSFGNTVECAMQEEAIESKLTGNIY